MQGQSAVKLDKFKVEATFQACDFDKAYQLCLDLARLSKRYGLGCAVGMPRVNE